MITRIKRAMIGQKRNLRALAGTCEFQEVVILEVVIERKSNYCDVCTFYLIVPNVIKFTRDRLKAMRHTKRA